MRSIALKLIQEMNDVDISDEVNFKCMYNLKYELQNCVCTIIV